MTTRTVRYIVRKALRRVAEETDYSTAPEEAFNDAFDLFIDMLNEWETRRYILFNSLPESLDDGISSADPIPAFVDNLAVKIAPHFHFSVTPEMMMQAANSLRWIRNRVRQLPLWCRPCGMPRGSGNYYWNFFLPGNTVNFSNTTTGTSTGTSSITEEDNQLCTQQGIPIFTSVTTKTALGECNEL